VLILSYQCSQLSTSNSIIKLFNDAKKYQDSEKKNKKSFVAVVVLDEVGLAEDSPNLPLKSLHPLLEDGTDGSNSDGGFTDEVTISWLFYLSHKGHRWDIIMTSYIFSFDSLLLLLLF